jgi:cysteine desulfurase
VSNIYFDNAATTKIDQSVINLMNNVMTNNYGNPNSTHSFGRSSRTLVEKARKLQRNLMFYPLRFFSLHVEQNLII